MGWSHFKIFSSRITGPEKLKFTWKKLSDIVQNQVFKIMAPGVRWDHNRGTVFTDFYIRNIFENILLNNYRTRKVVIHIEASRHTVD
jgi:hypothetical protein